MSAEENEALFRRWFEDVVNANNYAVVDELLAPGYVAHFRARLASIAAAIGDGGAVRRGVPRLGGIRSRTSSPRATGSCSA